MKPSKNAYIGYSYQQCLTFLLFAKMDAERCITKIEIEPEVDNNFEDVEISCSENKYSLQMKDFEEASLENLKISKENVNINGKPHKLSNNTNLLFFKSITITPNCEILGFHAFKNSEVYIISLSRSEIVDRVIELYESVFNIAVALTVFEKKGFIDKKISCNLINSIQNISEKGYGGLLSEYIMLHSPDIIQFLIENFNIDDLNISWLDLPSKYINVLPDNIFQSALMKELEYRCSNKEIEWKEVINVFDSDRKEELKFVLNLTRYKIKISKFHSRLEELKNENIDFVEFVPDNNGTNHEKNSVSRYNQGILSYEDKDYILERKMKSFEVAGFSNGYYAVFSDTNIYKLFEKDDIRNNFKKILYNAILGKIENINSFCSLYYFLGNLPKVAADFEIETDFEKLFDSFSSYLNLSMLKLNSNYRKEIKL